MVSWKLQGLIRNWWFPIIYTTATIVLFVNFHIWTHDPLDVWNYGASLLALLIENTVGIAMFSQTRRDAIKIRSIERIVGHLEEIDSKVESLLEGR